MANVIKIKDIIIGPRFRKDYGDIEGLSASLARHGIIHPVVLDDQHNLIAGGRRLAAAVNLGWTEIPYIILANVDDVTRKELEIEENVRRKDMTWVEEVKAVRNLYEVRQETYGARSSRLDDNSGYGVRDAAEELERSVGSVSVDINLARALDEFPEIAEEATKSAAWKRFQRQKEIQTRAELARRERVRAEAALQHEPDLSDDSSPHIPSGEPTAQPQENVRQPIRKASFKGKGTIYNADCRDVLRFLGERKIMFDCIVTDPPYGISMYKTGQKTGHGRLVQLEGGMYDDDPYKIMEMLDEAFGYAAKVLKPDGHAYVFFHMTRYEEIYRMLRHHFGQDAVEETPLIWEKNTPGIGDPNTSWVYSYEPCFWINKGRHLVKPQAFNVLRYDTVPPSQKVHPTQKPAALLRHIISASCVPGETVLDPFCGSGSTIVGAHQVGCSFVGIEREEAFYRKACDFVATEIVAEASPGEVRV